MAALTPVSIRLGSEVMDELKKFAGENDVGVSDAIRQFVQRGLELAAGGDDSKPAEVSASLVRVEQLLENTSLVNLQNLFIVKAALKIVLSAKGDGPWLDAEKLGAEELNRFLGGE